MAAETCEFVNTLRGRCNGAPKSHHSFCAGHLCPTCKQLKAWKDSECRRCSGDDVCQAASCERPAPHATSYFCENHRCEGCLRDKDVGTAGCLACAPPKAVHIMPHRFSGKEGWVPESNGTPAQPALEGPAFSCVTFNVWFDRQYMPERAARLLQILRECDAEFVCLQEATPKFLEMITQDEWVRQTYSISDPTGAVSFEGWYGVVLLAKPRSRGLFFVPFKGSKQGRVGLVGRYQISEGDVSHDFFVSTVHLESLANGPKRLFQMREMKRVLSQLPSALMMGDFNFDDKQDWGGGPPTENRNMESTMVDYLDVWACLRPTERGLTFEGGVNPYVNNENEKMRYDRILSRSDVFKPAEVSILGNEVRLWSQGEEIWPSDHYGLFAKFQLRE